MKDILIPERVEDYRQDVMERALPDEELRANDFYGRLAAWVIDRRTPILYEQDYEDEYANFSINSNWLLIRDYSLTKVGAPERITTMYALHEFSHMTHRLPTRLDLVTREQYAEDFTASEYRASNETEILIHYRLPNFRSTVFNGIRIAYDLMREKGISQPSSEALGAIRPLVIETNLLDECFSGSQADKDILARFKQYDGNRRWAEDRFESIDKYFLDADWPQPDGLGEFEYEAVISQYEPALSQQTYEQNIICNVRIGHAMCGLAIPDVSDFEHAIKLSKQLEGHHARIN